MGIFNRNKDFKIGNIEFRSNDSEYYSIGLKSYINKELKVSKEGLTLEQLRPILTYLVEFIQDDKLVINNGDKLSCFTWSLRFKDDGDFFEIFEAYPEKEGFIPGLSITYQKLSQQLAVCEQLNVEPDFPLFDQFILVDPLVRTGLKVNLFRWNKEDPDSGWVAITSEFQGTEFEQIPIGQFITYIEYAAQFMALPAGFKVIWDGNDAKIGFDDEMTINES